MQEYEKRAARQRKWMFYLLAIFVLGAGFTPYVQVFLGLLLGGVVSFYNLFLLQKKTTEFTEAIATERRPKGLGTVSRLAATALAVIIALRYEEYFNMIALIIGLMTTYVVIMIDFLIKQKE
ncbi:ATP synthase subunit I [Ornithinibacillus halophilus]|uniref:ATP synthase protein I n=1 Tax=Ornithinibacillus halophilus TaxID=930117 RepID=A0A1M5LVH2_9BACI|nr:ATP synthase subunit I [Ornithinibacillus halophilus]SHG68996.1 ATP synthase protein I [Ornithinibacillus halophilus]